MRKRGRGLRVERSDTARRGSAIGRRGTAQDEEAVSGRRSIAPRSARQGAGSAETGNGSETETSHRATNSYRVAKRAHVKGRSRADFRLFEARCAGLAPEGV